jgi:hypothetical protein
VRPVASDDWTQTARWSTPRAESRVASDDIESIAGNGLGGRFDASVDRGDVGAGQVVDDEVT